VIRRLRNRIAATLLSLAILLSLNGAGQMLAQAPASGSDQDQLRQLLKKYAESVDTLDLNLASEIWSHDAAVSFIHPRGTEIGFTQIEENFLENTMGTFSQRELLLENPVIHVYGDTAWSEMTWTFHATVKNGGMKITTTGRETQIYHKENGVWRIVHVHYSGPPVTGALKGF
jgi:ketosteroid isomerase-like protein